MSLELIINIIGIVGSILLLTAYYCSTDARFRDRTLTVTALNFFGAAGIAINSGYYGAYPSVALNIFWCVIALFAVRNAVIVARGLIAPRESEH
ncbi:CBU_0592 family membrane protein [Kordiimonas gwangyangensis]|uniref:CBU_0592 family membrane protein n=1 Tax=Kordiimonas gwangyangensis TaxID=288022 RepID=UPI000361B1BC|nr:hypothetical protein [Kordiimonas gwangyangensis]